MEAPSKPRPYVGWGPRPPASSSSAMVLLVSGRHLLGCVSGTQLSPPSCSLAHLQSWMAHLEMTLCLGLQSQLEKFL